MLNYIWLALIVIGISVALWSDVNDLSTNKFHNGEEFYAVMSLPQPLPAPLRPNQRYQVSLSAGADGNTRTLGEEVVIAQDAEYIAEGKLSGILNITVDDRTPRLWKEIADFQKRDKLVAHAEIDTTGSLIGEGNRLAAIRIKFDPVKFVKLNAVTNDGIIKYAKTAVELAIGLIGIMALWLGIMKVAEQAGLVSKLAGLLKPLTTRLFPDVPPDHPAMGAMIMNMSANMLGLANAATPLGLKAMEELNKLNKKAGTATESMCTFLVINTSTLQLIPATVIPIRAAAGSANPTEILGPVIVATAVTMTVGITTAKLLARVPLFRRQLEGEKR